MERLHLMGRAEQPAQAIQDCCGLELLDGTSSQCRWAGNVFAPRKDARWLQRNQYDVHWCSDIDRGAKLHRRSDLSTLRPIGL